MVKISVIMPVYNESETIDKIIEKVLKQDIHQLIIVDDGSTDMDMYNWAENLFGLFGTLSIHEMHKLELIFSEKNQGKGASIRKALDAVTGDIVIIQDADLEYDPADYNKLIEPIVSYPNYAVSYGYRDNLTIPNRFLTWFSNLFTHTKLFDMETCYKAFRSSVFKLIQVEENRFGFEPEITAKVNKIADIAQVPISYNRRVIGKKIGWQDGIEAIWCIIKYNLDFIDRGRKLFKDWRVFPTDVDRRGKVRKLNNQYIRNARTDTPWNS